MTISARQTTELDPLTVLVVDNSELIRQQLSVLLSSLGFRVLTACHGLDALTRVSENKPDAVLLDTSMSMLDGYDVCRLIKSDRQARTLPVILVSHRESLFDPAKAHRVNCDGYVAQPFTPTQMKAVLGNVFSAR